MYPDGKKFIVTSDVVTSRRLNSFVTDNKPYWYIIYDTVFVSIWLDSWHDAVSLLLDEWMEEWMNDAFIGTHMYIYSQQPIIDYNSRIQHNTT